MLRILFMLQPPSSFVECSEELGVWTAALIEFPLPNPLRRALRGCSILGLIAPDGHPIDQPVAAIISWVEVLGVPCTGPSFRLNTAIKPGVRTQRYT